MKTFLSIVLLTAIFIITGSCGQGAHHDEHEHETGDALEEGGNQGLYNQVMAVHDEVMPKMNDIYKLKEQLKDRIAETPTMTTAEKADIEALVAKLDSANEGMMVWMRHFNPLPDSLGEEQAKAYLEEELVKVNKVREDVNTAIEKAASKK